MFGRFYDDFTVGEVIQHDASKTILESDNNLFCLLTMNHHPVHLDVEYARRHQHGRILVVGTLTFSLTVGMSVPDISGKAIANLEYENVKHLAPVFIGDTIHAETHVLGKRLSKSKPDRGIVRVETFAYNQDGTPVLSFQRSVLVPKEHA